MANTKTNQNLSQKYYSLVTGGGTLQAAVLELSTQVGIVFVRTDLGCTVGFLSDDQGPFLADEAKNAMTDFVKEGNSLRSFPSTGEFVRLMTFCKTVDADTGEETDETSVNDSMVEHCIATGGIFGPAASEDEKVSETIDNNIKALNDRVDDLTEAYFTMTAKVA